MSGQKLMGSDVHIVVGVTPYARVHGQLVSLEFPKVTPKQAQELVFSLLSKDQEEKFILEKDLDIAYQTPDKTRYRINLSWEKGNVALSARIINATIPSMEDLGMPDVAYELVKRPAGLILMTGPTGCGKSTALASMIEAINIDRAANIITLEDPVEYVFQAKKSMIRQRQLGEDMLSFSQGLRHVLRQDPNVIMIGEMRDLDTIATTITLAETGHLVLATLHTYSAAQTINRIIDIFPPYQQDQVRFQLSMTLQAVITQRLLPRVSGGQVAAREVLVANSAVSNLIRENKVGQINTVIQTSAKEGMMSMDQALRHLYNEGQIERETALPYMTSSSALEK
ncbi:PilT/PilU family type 4a pilus ATPase [Candidatus Uhrbacteria bacterium]|nr:PilT/PilU family type 4a pilus ATPase [Candidatus Uhrbacteria bacterium]